MTSSRRIPLSQQISSVDVALSVLNGSAKPRKNEKELVTEQLIAAKRSLQWLAKNGSTVRAAMERPD